MSETHEHMSGKGNTQVGQNLTNEKIKIDNCTFNIYLNNRHDFDFLKKFIKKLTLKTSNNEND